jgi:hypothetical protein
MVLLVSPATACFIRERGGMLFVWPTRSSGPRCVLKTLRAALDPPPRALEYRRIAVPGFVLFLHPDMRALPKELWLERRGRRSPRVMAYWDGLAFVP